MTGDHIIEEWLKMCERQSWHASGCEATTDLRRRIDAALAEWNREHNAALAACATTGGQWGEEILELRAKLAEREAQCVALHGQLRVGVEFVQNGAPNEHFMEWARNADRVCVAIDDAARAFVERIRKEAGDAALEKVAALMPEHDARIQAAERERCTEIVSEYARLTEEIAAEAKRDHDADHAEEMKERAAYTQLIVENLRILPPCREEK